MNKKRFPGWSLYFVAGIAIFLLLQPVLWSGGLGFGEDRSVVTSVERDVQDNIIKSTETKTIQSAKTFWDWLSVLGVPLALLGFGAWLQQEEQRKAEEVTNEEALQVYIDRVSALLVDKNLMVMARKRVFENLNKEEQELLDASTVVIRARTLPILRLFTNDKERKNSIIRFLCETEIINKLKLDLSDADLSNTNFRGINLTKIEFIGANLSHADLRETVLSEADLKNADLTEADLRVANLCGANLDGTKLNGADLRGAFLGSSHNIRNAAVQGAKFGKGHGLFDEDKQFLIEQGAIFDELYSTLNI